jgi:carboxypeptidase Taq
MPNSKQSFQQLQDHLKKSAKFGYAASLLAWDHKTYMPEGGSDGRAEMLAAVETESFKIFTSEKTGQLLADISSAPDGLTPGQKLMVKRAKGMYQRQKKIPADFFEHFSLVKSKAQSVWVEAKQSSNFKLFQPHLEEIYKYVRQLAEIQGYQDNPYDALLPDYEPGMTTAQLKAIIKELAGLKSIVKIIVEKGHKPDNALLFGHFPQEVQKEICLEALKAVGYNFKSGRLDRSEHPFTITVGPDDVRLTTNFKPWTWTPAFFASLHEAGHGMYDQGKDQTLKWFYQDSGYSLGIHESQSRMWENMIGRSLPFWNYFYPRLQKSLPYYSQVALPEFYRAINTVRPSLIRTQADEVTYNLHIMLRFEIEEALVRDDLQVKELPSVWNQKIKEYLSVVPQNHSEGVLQDIHWSGGMVGYFPTYLLGNLYSAQLFASAKKEMPDLESQFEQGRFESLLGWLREKIHPFGLVEEAPQLISRVTGQNPSSKPWLEYIRQKYEQIYEVSLGD